MFLQRLGIKRYLYEGIEGKIKNLCGSFNEVNFKKCGGKGYNF